MGISKEEAIKELQNRETVFVALTGYQTAICEM